MQTSTKLDAASLRTRVQRLNDAGVTIATIARVAGIGRADVSAFKGGDVWGSGRMTKLADALDKLEEPSEPSEPSKTTPAPPPSEAPPSSGIPLAALADVPDSRPTSDHDDGIPDTLRPGDAR